MQVVSTSLEVFYVSAMMAMREMELSAQVKGFTAIVTVKDTFVIYELRYR